MKKLLLILCLVASSVFAGENPEIHCKHFFYGYPAGTPATNDLIIRDIYALSSNDETKFADWLAYRLDPETVFADVQTSREWKADPWLDEKETLEPEDYKGASKELKVDRGHQAPLASFKGTDDWAETNYLSNITPQKSDLNRGPWMILENSVRSLVSNGNIVYVMTGPLFEKEMPSLPGADEPHKVPSGYWKIVLIQPGKSYDSIKAAGFIFDQATSKTDKVIYHLCAIDEIETRAGLDFLRELPDDIEKKIESSKYQDWVKENF
ncbi:DNA/RNA non-specific endonuclease [bacterium]|nr:DNA/RNA non-specific endonuclease [bacterium]